MEKKKSGKRKENLKQDLLIWSKLESRLLIQIYKSQIWISNQIGMQIKKQIINLLEQNKISILEMNKNNSLPNLWKLKLNKNNPMINKIRYLKESHTLSERI